MALMGAQRPVRLPATSQVPLLALSGPSQTSAFVDIVAAAASPGVALRPIELLLEGPVGVVADLPFWRSASNRDTLKELYPPAQVAMFGAIAHIIEANAKRPATELGDDHGRSTRTSAGERKAEDEHYERLCPGEGMGSMTLTTTRPFAFMEDGTIGVDHVVVAHLRGSLAAFDRLRDTINTMLFAARPTEGSVN